MAETALLRSVSSFYKTKCRKYSTLAEKLTFKQTITNKYSELISFLTENESLIKQPPDATSSSDSDPDFSPSPSPQTYGLRPSRGSIPRTLISPPTSI
ncbi:hypothetical protein AVEN_217745-1 [Araneus ventricosus]|uniref:Uncharacterized protein n=1 Tax=Araneus ventricosus TaxID=182803 RepID=A0A4Y2R1D1_ARAVE|nr:hypothetical protein AVEN_121962-1 [Araneus ventricosus]GBN69423.1 hypothetical protein AVEN_217745-1 [Araneus ventricosus]